MEAGTSLPSSPLSTGRRRRTSISSPVPPLASVDDLSEEVTSSTRPSPGAPHDRPKHRIEQLHSSLFSQVSLLVFLTYRLVVSLGTGYRWMVKAVRLVLYALLLLPAWIDNGIWYFSSSTVIRGVRYGPSARNDLDVYLPKEAARPTDATSTNSVLPSFPVIVFFTGGAWVIGYKMWGVFVGRLFAQRGYVVICPDYRNFPQGTISDMLDDSDRAMRWVFEKAYQYGGDVNDISILGHSAGAHIASLSILQQAVLRKTMSPSVRTPPSGSAPHSLWRQQREENVGPGRPERISWPYDRVKYCIGISGPYDLVRDAQAFAKHGLSTSMLTSLFEGDLELHSPMHQVRHASDSIGDLASSLPTFVLLHGQLDKTVHFTSSELFYEELHRCRVPVYLKVYPHKAHTDFLLEDIISGQDFGAANDICSFLGGYLTVDHPPPRPEESNDSEEDPLSSPTNGRDSRPKGKERDRPTTNIRRTPLPPVRSSHSVVNGTPWSRRSARIALRAQRHQAEEDPFFVHSSPYGDFSHVTFLTILLAILLPFAKWVNPF